MILGKANCSEKLRIYCQCQRPWKTIVHGCKGQQKAWQGAEVAAGSLHGRRQGTSSLLCGGQRKLRVPGSPLLYPPVSSIALDRYILEIKAALHCFTQWSSVWEMKPEGRFGWLLGNLQPVMEEVWEQRRKVTQHRG